MRKLVGMKLGLIVLVLLVQTFVFGQTQNDRLVQLSGVVISSDSLQEMPYAAIYNRSVKRGTIADMYGFSRL